LTETKWNGESLTVGKEDDDDQIGGQTSKTENEMKQVRMKTGIFLDSYLHHLIQFVLFSVFFYNPQFCALKSTSKNGNFNLSTHFYIISFNL
jgi:hypothetical protein